MPQPERLGVSQWTQSQLLSPETLPSVATVGARGRERQATAPTGDGACLVWRPLSGPRGSSLGLAWHPGTSPYYQRPFSLRRAGVRATAAAATSAAGTMASGVTVNDEVIKVFNDMKVRKSSTQEEIKKRKKAVLFCLSDDKRQIIVEEAKQILVGDIGDTVEDPYTSFVKLLPLNDCRYALYDATYETKESKKEDLVFIFWAPESAPLKSKMIYASSKDAIKKKFTGIKHEWQVNGLDDIKDRSTLGEKLGGSVVVSLEGKPL